MKRRRERLQTREVRRQELSIAAEAEYIITRAMAEDARIVSVPPLVFFSTATGDAWMLDAEDSFAVQLLAAKTRLPFAITETPQRFAIEWSGSFRLDRDVFIFTDNAGMIRTILGYPGRQIAAALARARS
jgi:hypothetical protein